MISMLLFIILFKTELFKNIRSILLIMTPLRNRYEEYFGDGSVRKLITKQRELYRQEYLRINLSKTQLSKVEMFLQSKNVLFERGFLPNSIVIKKSFFSLSTSLPALSGEIYSQEIASQLPVNLIPNLDRVQKSAVNNSIDFSKFKGKIRVLDIAASPGSKITQIVDKMSFLGLKYEVVALEPNPRRLKKLINNIQKQEYEDIKVFNISAENFNSKDKFDIVLLDAPCSGNLIRDVDWLNKRSLKGILEKSKLQKKLLQKASELLSKKGLIVYSTCSLEPEENEENVIWATKELGLKEVGSDFNFPFKTKPRDIFVGKYKEKYKNLESIRLQPYESNTQGFFVSVMEKNTHLQL